MSDVISFDVSHGAEIETVKISPRAGFAGEELTIQSGKRGKTEGQDNFNQCLPCALYHRCSTPMSRQGVHGTMDEGVSVINLGASTEAPREGTFEDRGSHHDTSPTPPASGERYRSASGASSEKVLMKRTLLAQSKKIRQLSVKVDEMETERGAMGQQV